MKKTAAVRKFDSETTTAETAEESLRNEFEISATQFSSAAELVARGCADSGRCAAIEALETLRVALRCYASTPQYRAFSEWWARGRQGHDSDAIPHTAMDSAAVKTSAARCTQALSLCDAVPEDMRSQVGFWLEAIQDSDGAAAVPKIIAESAIAQRVLSTPRRQQREVNVYA